MKIERSYNYDEATEIIAGAIMDGLEENGVCAQVRVAEEDEGQLTMLFGGRRFNIVIQEVL